MTIFENGQLDQQQLQLLLQRIETQLQWGNGNNWRHQDFQTLSEKILTKTGAQLSTTTLKRIWGKLTYRSLPNTHTLNTLSQFADFENWLAFQSGNQQIISAKEKELNKTINNPNYALSGLVLRFFGASAFLLLISIAVINLASKSIPPPLSTAVLESIEFSSHRVTSGVPNTVIFNYDVSKVPSDSIQIQQNWDERRRFTIAKNQYQIASTYYYPGHWRAKLVVDNQIIREKEIYIKTEGWLTTINKNPIPRYLKDNELTKNGFLGISKSVQAEIEARTEAPEALTYHFIEDFDNLQGDNFSMEIAFKNTYTKGDGICQFSRIVVDCTKGIFIIPFSIPGCVGDLSMRFNEIRQQGKNHDFSAFGCDYTQWQKFRMNVKDKTAQLFLNGQLIYEAKYEEPIRKVAGMNIGFRGSGAIDAIKLIDSVGIIVYSEDFETNIPSD